MHHRIVRIFRHGQDAERNIRILTRTNRYWHFSELNTPFVNFGSIDCNIPRSFNAQTDTVAFHGNHRHTDVLVDDDFFTNSTGQN